MMKKKFNKALDILSTILMIFAIGMMIFTIVSVNCFNRQDKYIFGYKAFIVLSDSMSATDFDAGDLALVKDVDPSTLVEGDIIAYVSNDTNNYGEVVTHKIRSVNPDGTFTTYGTTTNTDDPLPVSYEQVIGKYQNNIPKVGSFFNFLKTVPGYICCIFIPFVLLILIQGIYCIRLFKRYKKEQMIMIKKERAALEKEREETRKMMEELMEMKKQMEQTKE